MASTRSSQKVRYGVIGLGHIAQSAVLPAFAHARNSELTALASSDAEKLEVLGERYQVRHRFGYERMADCLAEVDAVFICTPNTEHEAAVLEAAGAGRHVLCEKPLAVTDEACARMVEACRDAGVKLMTAYRLHFEPTTLAVLKRVRDGALGDLRYFSSSFSMQTEPGGIRTEAETGGGAVWDIGIYCVNAARMLFDAEPVKVQAHAIPGTRSGMPDVDETTTALMHFDGDRLAAFTCSFDAADVSSYRIVGTKGSILVEPAFEIHEAISYTATIEGKSTRHRGRKVDQFAAELVYFSRCILEDRAPEPSGEEGAWDVHIIGAIYEAAARGEAVSLGSFAEPGPEMSQRIALPPPRKARLVNVSPPHE
jgi:predicted dehydrogenase